MVPVSSARLWEWVVDRGADRAVSGARERVMETLSRMLIAAGEAGFRADGADRAACQMVCTGPDMCTWFRR